MEKKRDCGCVIRGRVWDSSMCGVSVRGGGGVGACVKSEC